MRRAARWTNWPPRNARRAPGSVRPLEARSRAPTTNRARALHAPRRGMCARVGARAGTPARRASLDRGSVPRNGPASRCSESTSPSREPSPLSPSSTGAVSEPGRPSLAGNPEPERDPAVRATTARGSACSLCRSNPPASIEGEEHVVVGVLGLGRRRLSRRIRTSVRHARAVFFDGRLAG